MPNKARKARELDEFHAGEVFHRREWRIQRIGWAALFVLLAAAMAGLFGDGPLAHRVIGAGDGIIEFDRFARGHAGTELRITSMPAGRHGAFSVRISSSFLDRYKIADIAPEPSAKSLAGTDVIFEFDVSEPAAAIVFRIEPERFGFGEGFLRLGSAEPVRVTQFVYP